MGVGRNPAYGGCQPIRAPSQNVLRGAGLSYDEDRPVTEAPVSAPPSCPRAWHGLCTV